MVISTSIHGGKLMAPLSGAVEIYRDIWKSTSPWPLHLQSQGHAFILPLHFPVSSTLLYHGGLKCECWYCLTVNVEYWLCKRICCKLISNLLWMMLLLFLGPALCHSGGPSLLCCKYSRAHKHHDIEFKSSHIFPFIWYTVLR